MRFIPLAERPSPLLVGQKILRERYPSASVAFVAGSSLRQEATSWILHKDL